MLSEHETLELLEQLKHGVIPASARFGESRLAAVSHWPVLTGGGICLNMQTVAALELNRQPESVIVNPSRVDFVTPADLKGCFQQVHHISTGIDERSLIIAYDHNFESLLSTLQLNEFDLVGQGVAGQGVEEVASRSGQGGNSSGPYEFSQAVAAAIDVGTVHNGRGSGLSFLAIDAERHSLAGSWQLTIGHNGIESTLFLGVISGHVDSPSAVPRLCTDRFAISIPVERVSRSAGSIVMTAQLAWPGEIALERTERHGSYSLEFSEADVASNLRGASANALVVQGMLQLSSDDLYRLCAEAIGKAAVLTFRFATESLLQSSEQLLGEGSTYRCVSVNGLPIRQAFLAVSEGLLHLRCDD